MPNHCTNLVTLVGAPAEVARAVERLRGKDPTYKLSEHEQRLVTLGLMNDSSGSKEYAFCFHKIIPVPDEILRAGFDRAGYDWQSKNWGTKWGAYDLDEDLAGYYDPAKNPGHIHYKFDTAWGPPIPVLGRLAEMFPELRIYHSFGEEYPTRGRHRWLGGQIVEASSVYDCASEKPSPLLHELYDQWQQKYLALHPEWVASFED